MRTRNKIVLALAAVSLAAIPAIQISASSIGSIVSGGWSESTGYYVDSTPSKGITTFAAASSSPSEHHGERKSRFIDSSSGISEYAAYGYTVWPGVYHYTTAQIQDNKGTVRTTSGRKYGTGGTTAQSPWYLPKVFENIEARTYWGQG